MSKEINLEGYRLAHTMIRVKDLEASFNFYCKTLGMKVLRKTDYPEGKFTNAFIGDGLETESPCLELTHNWDQKEDYDKGNGWALRRSDLTQTAKSARLVFLWAGATKAGRWSESRHKHLFGPRPVGDPFR